MEYSVEELVFIVKTFYQTSSFCFFDSAKKVSEEIQWALGCSRMCNYPSGTEV
jgi:hypothetical protein